MYRWRFIITTVATITPPVMIVMMVTISLYCYGRRERVCPGERGPSWRYSHAGGASAALRYRQGGNRGLQGLRFAPRQGWALNSHPLSRNCHPFQSQCWRGLPPIPMPKSDKTATVPLGRRKGPTVNADPLAVCSQAMRYTRSPVPSFADTMFRPSFFLSAPAKVPRTVWACQPVVSMIC